jgi:molybdate transport system substrate-binding protein
MIFAAQSLKKPFTEIGGIYESRNPGVKVNLNCAGTGTLLAQMLAGAPVDVFASASRQDMDTLLSKGTVDTGSVKVFALNSVVLVTAAGNKKELKGFADLALDKVKRLAVGNPKLAPVGVYGEEVLAFYAVKDAIKDRLIYCDQVAQVCDYTAQGEVDAGIVYRTDWLARRDSLALVAEAPENSHRLVEYPIAVLKNSANKDGAGKFITLLFSEQGKKILTANGFLVGGGSW